MKNLRDIEVKLGDKVYFEDGRTVVVLGKWYSNYKEIEDDDGEIIKIERQVKYETIYEAPKQILDKEEKEYLENVIRPFKDRVIGIKRTDDYIGQYISIKMFCEKDVSLPYFKADSMYKGMELWKEYTIKELGLFEGEE